jgi:uncharacterized protein YyaL (SSP411 family)
MPAQPDAPATPIAESHNRLMHEKSPYLLQHADNPVDWYPWGDEAFATADREDKPIFLSIGYSSCHWCHVMEHESFEDAEVAAVMNEAFVNIKVDREERPDIDNVYMTVAQVMTGRGGWPLTILMTPQRVPFFAATYIPKHNRFGQAGMMTLIPAIKERWEHRRHELLNVSQQVNQALQQIGQPEPGDGLDEGTMRTAYQQLLSRFDARHGGFGTAPKFPTPHNLLFLLRYWRRTRDHMALQMVEDTLLAMRRGGVFDHIGFGFHRYSTDAEWVLPHFEKMLYDQAMLAMAYTEAYQATGKEGYRRTAEEVYTYVLRDMTAPEGAFYSAEDADSEGEEGKFYLWSIHELRQALGDAEAGLISRVFEAQPGGNFADEATGAKTRGNILHLKRPLAEWASHLETSEQELRERIAAARHKLFARRDGRVHPFKDDKVLTDWNGLMVAALAKAAQAFNEPCYAQAANRAVQFILTRMVREDGRLLHRYRDGEAALPAYAADYAFLIWSLLDLYEATFEVSHLRRALAFNRDFIQHFWDGANGGFFSTSDDAEELLVRQKEIYDGAIPSANSVAMSNLLRLARVTADPHLEEMAAQLSRVFSASVEQSPMAHTQLMVALDFALGPSYEVVIAGKPGAEDTAAMLSALGMQFVPNKVVVFRPDAQLADLAGIAPFTEHQPSLEGRATAYVCRSHKCEFPTTEIDRMINLLHAEE